MPGEDKDQRNVSDYSQSELVIPGVNSQSFVGVEGLVALPRILFVKIYKALLAGVLFPIVSLLAGFLLVSGATAIAALSDSHYMSSLLSFLAFPCNWIKARFSEKRFLFLTLEGSDLIRAITGYFVIYAEFTGHKLFNMYLRFKDLFQYYLNELQILKTISFISQVMFFAVSVFNILSLPLLSLYDITLRKHFRCVRYIRRAIERHVNESPSRLSQIKENGESDRGSSPSKAPTESRPKRKREQLCVNTDILSPTSPEYIMAQDYLQASPGQSDGANSPRIEVQPPTDEADD